MKRISKRIIATLMALIFAMPVILINPFTASAVNNDSEYLSNHLIARYFTDSALIEDKAGNNNLETVGSGASWETSGAYNAAKFPGGDSNANTNYYRVGLSDMLSSASIANGLTISFIARRGSNDYSRYFELTTNSGYGSGDNSSYVFFSCNQNSKIRSIPYGKSDTSTPSITDDGGWHQWTLTIRRGTMFIYRDGVFSGMIEDSNRITDAWFNAVKQGYLLIGASSYSDDPLFSGSIRDFKIYDVALTSLQIRSEAVSKPGNHNDVNVRYETSVNFHGAEGTDYAIFNNSYYYSPINSAYGLTRYSSSQNIYNDDGLKYFSMWNFSDKLTYTDNTNSEQGIFQNNSDFRFDVTLGARNDSASAYLIGIFDKNGNIPIQLLKNGNISVNSNEVTGVNAVYSGSTEKYYSNYTFSFDFSKQILHFSCYGEYTDSSHNFTIEKDVSLSDYNYSLNPSDLAGINILDGSGDGHVRFGGISFYLPYNHVEPTIEGLKEAVAAYEAKMKSNKVYSNTLQAYQAYVLANRYIDAAEYGSRTFTSDEISSVANTLETATNNMTVWNPKQGTYHATFSEDNDYISDSDYMKTYVNVLWANDVTTAESDAAVYEPEMAIYQSSEKVNPRLFHPSAVLLYDGKTTPAIPVMSYFRHWSSSFHTFNIYYSSIFLNSDTSSFEINSKWRNGSGSGGNESFNYQWHYLNNTEVDIAGYETFDIAQHWGKYFTSSYEWNIGYANQIRFIGDLQDTEYCKTYDNVSWGFNFYNTTSNKKEVRATSKKPIYVINYKSLIDALSRAASKTSEIDSFREGGMLDFFTLYDGATSFDPQTAYDYSLNPSQAADNCAQDIKNLCENLDSATSGREDTYPSLIYEMKENQNSPTGNTCEVDYSISVSELNQTYTYNSISAFRRAYKDAVREMYLLVENGYSATPATLEALQASHASLEELADFSSLDAAKEAAFERMQSLDESLYTETSFAEYSDNLSSQFEFPYEYLGDRTNTGVSEQAQIDAEAEKFADAENIYLIRRSKLESFDKAYNDAVEFLSDMAVLAPQYLASDVNELIDLVESADVQKYAVQTEDDRKDYAEGGAEEQEANEIAGLINAKVAEVKASEGAVDVSAYQQAVFIALTAEQDAYDYPQNELDRDLNVATSSISTTLDYNGLTLKVIKDDAKQALVNAVTTLVQSSLNNHIRTYSIKIIEGSVSDTDGITFNGGTHSYDGTTNTYYATYNTKLNLKADSYSAWYMEFDSPSVARTIQYQDSGKRYSTKVIGNINVYVYNSEGKKKVTIARKYSDNTKEPIMLESFVDNSYILPEAPAIAFYEFGGYSIGENSYNAGDAVNITQDTLIYANYILSESLSCAVNIDGETGFSAAYNDRINLNGDNDTYAWLELDKSSNLFKPFYIGRDVSFYVTESITLKKVTEEEFSFAGYKLPAINIRQDGTYTTTDGGVKKVYFNGQYVTDGAYEIAEYGMLLGKANSGGSINESDVVLENIGASEEYTLTRFKSTKNVGANQFTIGVKNLSGDVIYKGYITYKLANGEFVTVYTDAIAESIV